ncbi:Rho GTPase-activating protein 5 [Apophysomyces sp. BC1034]|nr:Rho GTPase-activating protein 5 [Apophysomyces sp. BC1015]KAG0188040.1 Rho GTPase-activating protein 5 [Apophysomyces sp. BC1034]
MASLDASDRIWVWGGVSDNSTGFPGIGYWDGFTILDRSGVNVTQLGVSATQLGVPQGVRRIGCTATLSNDNNIIYYIGGYNAQMNGLINQTAPGANPYTLSAARMSDILTFDTVSVTWSLTTAGGSQLPSPREYHTAIIVPNSNTLLLYGGAAQGDPNNATATADDYVYTLDMSNFIWTPVTNLGPLAGAGPRFGHSAIVHNNSMFILFGKDGKGNEKNDFHVMDLTHRQWTNSYLASGLYSQPAAGSPGSPNSITESSPNIGAIVGGVVGGVVGIAAIAGLIAFFMVRKKKKAARNAATLPNTPGGGDDHKLSDAKNLEKSPSSDDGKKDIETSMPSVPASVSPHGTQYSNDSDIRGRQETTPFIDKPLPPHNGDSQNHNRQQQQQSSYVMTVADPFGGRYADGDLESDKPDGQVPRFILEPMKPDGI